MSNKKIPDWGKGTVVKSKKGTDVTLLTPQQKANKFFHERIDYPDGNGCRYTNDGHAKLTKDGELLALSDEQKAYRLGYERAIKDTNKLYRKTHPEYKSKYVESIKQKN